MFRNRFAALSALQIARSTAIATVVTLGAVAIACSDQTTGSLAPASSALLSKGGLDGNTVYGPLVTLGAGTARTYATMENGTVVELGVEMTEGALQGLPVATEHAGHHNHSREFAFELALPEEAGVTAYKTVNLGWMPNGHEPPYNRPHFDFHFYTITEAERAAIDPSDPQWAQKAGNLPAPQFRPARYFALSTLIGAPPAAVTVPRMGMHWLDIASPELSGAEFTYTFFYGSWNGAMIFDEPMITKAFLESRQSLTVSLPPAAEYSPAGLRARGYRVYWENGRHRVALIQLAS